MRWVVASACVLVMMASCEELLGLKRLPHPDASGPCTLPTGTQACVPQPAVGAPGDDPDVDSIPNSDDDCPQTPDGDQHDEDGDCRGDACDLCPAVTDASADCDGDGVGDACDPHPNAPDRLTFDPFAGTAVPPPGWAAPEGATWWSESDEYLADMTVTTAITRSLWTAVGDLSNGATLEVEVYMTGGGLSDLEVGVEVARQAATDRGVFVGVVVEQDTGARWLRAASLDHLAMGATITQTQLPEVSTARYVLHVAYDDAGEGLTATVQDLANGTSPVQLSVDLSSAGGTRGGVGLVASGVQGHFEYAQVTTR